MKHILCHFFVFAAFQLTAQTDCEDSFNIPNAEIVEPSSASPVLACPFEQISLIGSEGTGQNWAIQSYDWQIIFPQGDTVNYTGVEVEFVVQSAGAIDVELVVTNELGCISEPATSEVWVSTIPIFNTEVSTPLCEDAPGDLNGNSVESIQWTSLPPVGVLELADIPDATGVAFTSELFIDFFDTDQVLEDCDDIELITANIEHSFIGDLSFWITCPDGTEVLLMDNGASGGPDPTGCTPDDLAGNNLGIVDVEGFDYSWNMDAEWVLDDANNPDAASPMPAGTYLPCGDLCDFEGCPLNGIWTFNVIDQWVSDNGTLFEWGIDFNPEIVPVVTTFTPVIGLGSDSSYWHPVGDLDNIVSTSDLGVVGVSDDANYVDLMFPDPGTFEFGYVVTNNFGCTWDTTLTVEVVENPGSIITAGPDQIFCSDPVTLLGAIDDGGVSACGGDAGSFEVCLGNGENVTYTYCPDNPGDGTMMSLNFTGGFLETCCDFMSVFDGPDATAPLIVTTNGDFTGVDFMATNPSGCLTIVLTSDGTVSCGSGNFDPLAFCATCAGSVDVCSYDWLWEPAEYLDDNTLAQPTVIDFEGEPIEFTLFVEPVGFDNCQATDVVTVSPGFAFEVEQQQPSCFANDGIIGVEVFEDANDPQGPFIIQLYVDGPGGAELIEELEWDNITDFYYNDLVPGDYSVVVFNNEGCVYSESILMQEPSPLTLNVSGDQIICSGGMADLGVTSNQDTLNLWTYVWDNGLPNGPVQQVSPNTSTVYTVQGFDDIGCPTDEYQIQVFVFDSLQVELISPSSVCETDSVAILALPYGGDGWYSWDWTINGNSFVGSEFLNVQLDTTSEVCVSLSDGCSSPHAYSCTTIDVQEVVSGYCDCDGNVLDALGVCGGDCLGDSDDDGICDDIDDCDGLTDECGICNGPGAIYECGCFEISDEYCDCQGNQLDVLGVCGGDCLEDFDGDGICDCTGAIFSQPLSPEEYVNEVLLGDGVAAFNINFIGSISQLGYVNCGGELGISEGLSLHTDNSLCDDICGDCLGGSVTDTSLLELANSVPPLIGQSFTVSSVNDVAVLEFDFYAAGDSIYFNYIFGSDEYLTYVNTTFNDVFGFFLSGPGIEGPYSSPEGYPGGSVNLAVVPGSDPGLPITVSSVNNVTNAEYYVDNPSLTGVCINGYTSPITAKEAVQCGEVYHIRLAIADGSDTALESFVILEAGSFTSENPCILGCTDDAAWNFDEDATADNGTCADCPPAMEYCGEGTVWDDLSQTCIGISLECGPGTVWSDDEQTCVVELPGDMDFDLCVGVPDLLALLVVWGTCVD